MLEQRFRVLVAEGDGALTVEALCERLEWSKGSLYHHFDGRPDYVTAVLETWEGQAPDRLIETGRSDAPAAARSRLS